MFESASGAGRATARSGVKGERSGFIFTLLGFRRSGKETADGFERAHEKRRRASCRFTDRGLIDKGDIADVFGAEEFLEFARGLCGLTLGFHQGRNQDVLDQGGLTGTRDARNTYDRVQRNADV